MRLTLIKLLKENTFMGLMKDLADLGYTHIRIKREPTMKNFMKIKGCLIMHGNNIHSDNELQNIIMDFWIDNHLEMLNGN